MDSFSQSPACGFDGVFDWDFLQGCFGDDRRMPMDFDGVVERNGQFLVFETKKPGVPVPSGQAIALERLRQTGLFTIFIIWGKEKPLQFQILHNKGITKVMLASQEIVSNHAKRWYQWACGLPQAPFINKDILNEAPNNFS